MNFKMGWERPEWSRLSRVRLGTQSFAVLNVRARIGAILGLFIAALFLTNPSSLRAAGLVGICLGVLMPYNIWLYRQVRRVGTMHNSLPWFDAVTLSVVCFVVPEVSRHAIVLSIAQLAITCVLFSPLRAVAAITTQMTCVSVMSAFRGTLSVEDLIVFVLICPGIVATSALVLAHERGLRNSLEAETLHDALTGLGNRKSLSNEFPALLKGTIANNTRLGLLVIDLNGFREVNETVGHGTGDELLKRVAERLQRNNTDAKLVRLGGDEFALVIEVDSRAEILRRVELVTTALSQPIEFDSINLIPRASIGIAICPDNGTTSEELWRHADNALLLAKQQGKSFSFESRIMSDDERRRRLQILGEIPHAIETDQFVLFHQPKVNLDTGATVGSEALLRWRHPVHGLLAPDSFIELAEVSGLIVPLTRWVVSAGVKQLAEWGARYSNLSVSINVSARDLSDLSFAAYVAGELQRYNVRGSRLTFELTERDVMQDHQRARNTMDQLRAMGIRLSIDDFGTGYSSLGYLHRLPVDEVKIDRSFIREMRTNDSVKKLVQTVINMSRDLGLEIVAEGVEHRDESTMLREFGCYRAQGYLFAKPLAPEAFEAFLDEPARIRAN